ncbi:MAG: TonB-dependent receptor [Acidobacteria bacterium]|nr:TonB-dependent receptor [Acidobacteriota bacterium]
MSLPAQVATGSLFGTVTDPNGAVVPEAKLRATHEPTRQDFETVTSGAGLFVLPSLPSGPYVITVEKPGFKKLTRSGIEVRVALRQILELRLEVGEVTATIEVTESAPLLESTSVQRGQNFQAKFMNNLPLFTGGIRNAAAFVGYMPGVSRGTPELSISGSGGRASEVQIDGASLIIPESGGVVFNFPGAEMFSEFKLLNNTYDAEYGRFGGGVQIFVTKSGNNDFHANGFLNLRRDIWNANAWANNARGLNAAGNPVTPRPKERFNEQGGSGGGPVFIPKVYDGRNKTFWYVTYSKDKRPATIGQALNTVPTALMKAGNFSQVSQLIYDPATTAGAVRTPFAGNIIPQSRFSSISQKLIPAIPDPTRASLISNYDFVNETVVDAYIWNLKLDHAFTPNNRLSFLVTKENTLNGAKAAFPGPLGQGLQGYQKPDNWRINHDLVIKPNLLNHATFGYSRTRQTWDNPFQKGGASKFGFPGITGDSDATPRVQFTGADGLTAWGVQDGKVSNGSQINITYHFSDGYTWLRGKHEYKIGGEIRRLHTTSAASSLDLAGTNGQYFFDRAQTALPTNLAGTGHAFASLLLGSPNSANRVALPVLIGNIRYGYHAAYFMDTWKVTSKLTLNLSFRYDLPINWHEKNGDYSMVDLKLPNPGAGNLPGAVVFAGNGAGRTGQKRFYPTDFGDVGPRVGFAYRLFPKTVLRGGYGIFYQTLGNGGCGCRLGFSNPISLVSDGVNGALANWDTGILAPPAFRPPPLIDPTVGNFAGDMDVMGPNFGKAPRIYNWSFNIQHEVNNFLIDVAYVGNRGHRLNSTIDINQLAASRLPLGSLLSQRIDSPAVIAAGFTKPFASFPNTQTLAQALRPYPQFFGVLDRNSGVGRTWYDALQAKIERRFGSWQMMANYTWSKSLAANHYRQIFSQHFNVGAQDAYNVKDMKAISPFDQPNVLTILNAFELPFGKGKRFMKSDRQWMDWVVGHWTISSIQNYRSGPPIQVSAPNTLANGVLFTRFKKANRGPAEIRTGIDRTTLDPNNPATRWFNVNAYTVPGQFEMGTASSYDSAFRQPPQFEENLSISKRLKFPVHGERTVDLLYRADAFNLFNRTNFGGVVGAVGNPNFGRPTGPSVGARIITMGIRLEF